MNRILDDKFLYAYIPQIEQKKLEQIPPESKLNHQFSKHFKRKMKILLKYERRTPTMRQLIHWVKNAAAILLIIISLTFGTVLSVEAYRVRFFEFVTNVWEELTSVVIKSDDNSYNDTLMPITPAYIPNGYDIFEQSNNKYENIIIFTNDTGTEIYYAQELLTQSEFIIDSENTEIESFFIDSQEIYLIVNKNTTQLYWHDNSSIFSIISSLDKTELIKMCESIIKK